LEKPQVETYDYDIEHNSKWVLSAIEQRST